MIKNNESKVEITTRNIKYYTNKNYKCDIGDIITIDITTMPKMSHNKVIAICEICQIETEISFSKYNKNKERQEYYSCKKCSFKKRENTNLKKYGVKSAFNRPDVLENNRKWMKSDEFRMKSRESLLVKYGVDSFSKTESFKEKMSNFVIENKEYLNKKRELTCLEKYGYKSILEIPGFKEKAMFDKYGATCSFFVPEIKEKIENINLEKFGHISPFGNEDIQKKCLKKIIDIYGVDNVWKNKDMINLIIERKRQLGIYYKDDEVRNKYLQFRKKVVYLTYKNKSKLLEIWDGKDFYTGEYIKNNFNLNSNDNNYPTIDHKVPIFFGYINNVDINEISSIDNLCWTCRINNLRKSKKDISIFQNEIKVRSI